MPEEGLYPVQEDAKMTPQELYTHVMAYSDAYAKQVEYETGIRPGSPLIAVFQAKAEAFATAASWIEQNL